MRRSSLRQAVVLSLVLGLPGLGSAPRGFRHAPAAAADADLAGRPGSYLVNRTAILYEHPSSDSRILRMIRRGTTIHVVEARGAWYRVEPTRADRPSGYIRRSLADAAPSASPRGVVFRPGIFRVTQPTKVRVAPSSRARTVTTLATGAKVHVVGESGTWYRIQSETGKRPPGYVLTSAVRRVRNLD